MLKAFIYFKANTSVFKNFTSSHLHISGKNVIATFYHVFCPLFTANCIHAQIRNTEVHTMQRAYILVLLSLDSSKHGIQFALSKHS